MNDKIDPKGSAIRCAYLDLIGVLEAFKQGDPFVIDIDSIRLTVEELEESFPDEISEVYYEGDL